MGAGDAGWGWPGVGDAGPRRGRASGCSSPPSPTLTLCRSASGSVAAAHLQQESGGAGDREDRPRSVRGTVGRWGERVDSPKTPPNAPPYPVLHFGACRDVGMDRQGKWWVLGEGGGELGLGAP